MQQVVRGPTPRAVALGFAGAVGLGSAIWILWGPMFTAVRRGQPLGRCMKNYYTPDQYSVLAIARNVRDGHPLYVEPFSSSGTSVYPSAYYYALGKVAAAADTSVVWAWNVVGLIVSCALLLLSVWWARRLAPGTRAWLLAPLPFLLGTYTWWQSRDWIYLHANAVLWPPVSSLYSPGAENPALVLAGVSLLSLTLALVAGGGSAWRWAAAGGAAAGISLHVHANVTVFALVAATLVVLWEYLLTTATRRRRRWIVASGAILVLTGALVPASGFVTRIGLFVLMTAAALVSDRAWRHRHGRTCLVFVSTALVTTLPLSLELAAQVLSADSYFAARESSVAGADTNLPVSAVVLLLLPVWVLVLAVIARLAPRSPGPRRPVAPTPTSIAWLALLAGLTTATVLLMLGGRLGAEGLEWHRFAIYGPFLCAMAAAPGLWLLLRHPRDRRERRIGLGAAVFVLASLPTTVAFATAQRDAVTCVPPEEIQAYATLGRAAGPHLLLLDRCLRAGDFKVYSGARVAWYHNGIATPERLRPVEAAMRRVIRRQLPSTAELRAAGISRFLTHDRCDGVPRSEVQERFGVPAVRVALGHPADFGFPAGLTYELYDVPPVGSGVTLETAVTS